MTMVMVTVARAMVTATRVVGKRQQGQWRRQQLWQAMMRGIAAAMRVVSNKESEGGKAMATVTRVVGKQWRQQQRGQWRWQ
jgi:hypothetical protein